MTVNNAAPRAASLFSGRHAVSAHPRKAAEARAAAARSAAAVGFAAVDPWSAASVVSGTIQRRKTARVHAAGAPEPRSRMRRPGRLATFLQQRWKAVVFVVAASASVSGAVSCYFIVTFFYIY